MRQPSQYNQWDKTKAWYRDRFILHTATHYGGSNSSIGKQNGRGPHLQKREILEPDLKVKRCPLQSRCNALWDLCQRAHRITSPRPFDHALNIWSRKTKSSKATDWSSRKQFPLELEQKEWEVAPEGMQLAKWLRAWIDNPYMMRVWVQIPMVQRKNRRKTLGVMTRMWSAPLMGAIH